MEKIFVLIVKTHLHGPVRPGPDLAPRQPRGVPRCHDGGVRQVEAEEGERRRGRHRALWVLRVGGGGGGEGGGGRGRGQHQGSLVLLLLLL